MTNLDSILKSRDITLPTKLCLVKVMVFPVIMCGCESWTIKKVELWRIDAFELWCWRRTLESPLDCKEVHSVYPKEISPEYSLEGLMLKLKLQYFGHLMQRTDSLGRPWCWQRLKVQGEGDNTGSDGWMASPTQWTWVWVTSMSWWWTRRPGVLQSMGSQRVGYNWATELNCTEVSSGLPRWISGKESTCLAGAGGDMSLIPVSGRSLEEKMATHSTILAWKSTMDRGAWWSIVHRVTASDVTEHTQLSDLVT